MAAAIGVHLGFTSASLAICKDGRTEIIANDAGDRETPALVACCGNDISVGLPAKHGLIRNAKNTMSKASRIIGLRFSDIAVQQEAELSMSKIINKDGEPFFEVEFSGKTTLFSPRDVVKMIFKKMLETGQAHCGSDVQEAVVSVPLHYTDEQQTAIREAAEDAGFEVLRVISQPAAAALAYDVGQSDRSSVRTVIIYRLGGVSVSATVLAVNGGIYRVIATESDTGIGGNKFDELLAQHLATEFRRQNKLDITTNPRAVAKLQAAAELCKRILSSRDSATCSLESLFEGIDFQCTVSRARFECLCSDVFQQSIALVGQVLSVANINKDDVNQVILVGGSTRVPRIQQLVQEYFVDKEVSQSISPEGVIAYGAAVQASLLKGKEQNVNSDLPEVDCTAKAIGFMLEETETCICQIIPKYSPVPLRRTQNFTTCRDNQESVCLCVYEIEDEKDVGSTLMAKVVLDNIPPMAKGEAKIVGTFHVRRDGSLHIHLVEKGSESCADITIETS